jgi:hypothetical protein
LRARRGAYILPLRVHGTDPATPEIDMPAPLALSPIAWTALRFGAMAAVAVYAARNRHSAPKVAEHEHVLDGLAEGIEAAPHVAEAERGLNGNGRIRRTFRFGPGGPGFEIDAAALGRLRVRRV